MGCGRWGWCGRGGVWARIGSLSLNTYQMQARCGYSKHQENASQETRARGGVGGGGGEGAGGCGHAIGSL